MNSPVMGQNIDLEGGTGRMQNGKAIWHRAISYVSLYLIAIVAANLLVARFGPAVVIINAFVLIGFDLTSRDVLHEMWHHKGLAWKMGCLILAGSVITILLNVSAWRIALASCCAFAGAAVADTVIYQGLFEKPRLLRMNGSNVVSAAVDSFIFPAIAFGFPLMLWVMLGQFAAKAIGGGLWSLLINRILQKRQAR